MESGDEEESCWTRNAVCSQHMYVMGSDAAKSNQMLSGRGSSACSGSLTVAARVHAELSRTQDKES